MICFSSELGKLFQIYGPLIKIEYLLVLILRAGCTIVTRKEIVWKGRNYFCLCYVPALTSAQSFRKGTKSSGGFNNINLNIKVGKKYHLSLDYV